MTIPDIVIHAGGYVGLTAGIHYANAGKRVLVCDPDPDVVFGINTGTPKANEFLGYLGHTYPRELLRATTEIHDTIGCDVHVIAVPSEAGDEPYMDIVGRVLGELAVYRRDAKTLVIIESTMQPGAVDGFLAGNPDLSRLTIAVAPRRDWFASKDKHLGNLYRVVGGVTPEATAWAVDVISVVTPVDKIMQTDYRTAEVVKPLENALFHAPIALCHSLALAYPHLDMAEATRMAATHWRFESFGGLHLNAAVGGRCIPLAAKYLRDGAGDQTLDLIDAMLDIEEAMPEAVAQAITKRVGLGARVLILGVGYRPEFKDAGMSPGLRVAAWLPRDTYVDFCDPFFPNDELLSLAGGKHQMSNCGVAAIEQLDGPFLGQYQAVLLATPHAAFETIPEKLSCGQLVFDARGAWLNHKESFRNRGILWIRTGSPDWV